ncbi:MAG: response regulator [Bacteroidales bacterium]|nr:response regulator [Bacteroidales bacterium]
MAKGKILIVDDDHDLIEGTQAILESQGYEVSSALNKNEGLNQIRINRPDLIILDVNMTTEQEGFEMNLELRENPDYNSIPVLMQTGIEVMTSNRTVATMIREMRKDENFKDNKVLLCKNEVEGAAGVDYLSEDGGSIFLPVEGFLSKPVDPNHLISEVERLIK